MSTPSGRNRRLLGVVVVPFIACAPDPSTSGFTVRDSAGVRILATTASVDSTVLPWTVDPEPSLDIGTAAGDESRQLFGVGDVLRLSDGTIVLENRGSSEIRFFDASGKGVRSTGGSGDGPGEYRVLAGLAEAPDGSLVAFDRGLGRFTTLGAESTLKGTVQLQPTRSSVHPLRLYRLAGYLGEGTVVLVAYAYPADMQPRPMVYWDSVPSLAYSLDGTLRDTVAEFSGMDMYATGSSTGHLWFGRLSSVDVQGGEIFITDGGAYEVRVYGPDGHLRRILRHERGPRSVTAEEEELLKDWFFARAADEEGRRRVRKMLSEYPRAQQKPWISNLIVDETGAVWVEEWESRFVSAPRTWGVFSAEGRWIGSIRLPARFVPRRIGRDYVLGLWRDDLDVEHVQKYRLRR